MDISLFGYKISLEILILIGVIYLILIGHTFCGCCNFGLMEGLDVMQNDMSGNKTNVMMGTQVGTGIAQPAGNMVARKAKDSSTKVNGKTGKEGFVGANTNFGQSSPYDLSNDNMVNTSSWSAPDLTVTTGKPLSQGVKEILDRPKQPVPLPEGEMLMFANTPFKPECCPNTYSTSTGCACMTTDQYNGLITRWGNNVPYSEY